MEKVSRRDVPWLALGLEAVVALAQGGVALCAGGLLRAVHGGAQLPPGMTPLSRWWAERALRAEPRTWAWLAVAAVGLRVAASAGLVTSQARTASKAGSLARRDLLSAALAEPRCVGLGAVLRWPEEIEAAIRARRARQRASLQLVVLGGLALALDPLLAAGLLGLLGLFAMTLRPVRRHLRAAHAAAVAAGTARVDAIQAGIVHAAVWSSLGASDTVLARSDALSAEGARLAVGAERNQALASGVNELLAAVAIALLVGLAAPSATTARPTLVPLLVVLLSAYRPLRDLAESAGASTRGALARAALAALPAPRSTLARSFAPEPLVLSGFAIEIGSERARAGLDATAAVGAPLVIVGPPGAGKSALLEALVGARDHRGTARLGAEDLGGPPGLGRPFAWVPASPPTLPGTFDENLWPAAPNDAVRLSKVRAILGSLDPALASLPGDTPMAGSGRVLSSGEAQRLALARAIASDRPVLLLDEPTAHLDAVSERSTVELLRAQAEERVLVLVTHRAAPRALAATVLDLGEAPAVQGE